MVAHEIFCARTSSTRMITFSGSETITLAVDDAGVVAETNDSWIASSSHSSLDSFAWRRARSPLSDGVDSDLGYVGVVKKQLDTSLLCRLTDRGLCGTCVKGRMGLNGFWSRRCNA